MLLNKWKCWVRYFFDWQWGLPFFIIGTVILVLLSFFCCHVMYVFIIWPIKFNYFIISLSLETIFETNSKQVFESVLKFIVICSKNNSKWLLFPNLNMVEKVLTYIPIHIYTYISILLIIIFSILFFLQALPIQMKIVLGNYLKNWMRCRTTSTFSRTESKAASTESRAS